MAELLLGGGVSRSMLYFVDRSRGGGGPRRMSRPPWQNPARLLAGEPPRGCGRGCGGLLERVWRVVGEDVEARGRGCRALWERVWRVVGEFVEVCVRGCRGLWERV